MAINRSSLRVFLFVSLTTLTVTVAADTSFKRHRLLAAQAPKGANSPSLDHIPGDAQEASSNPQPSSTHCNATGACVPCTRQQQDSDPACWGTGFRQEFTCIQTFTPQGKVLGQARGKGNGEIKETPQETQETAGGKGEPKEALSEDAASGASAGPGSANSTGVKKGEGVVERANVTKMDEVARLAEEKPAGALKGASSKEPAQRGRALGQTMVEDSPLGRVLQADGDGAIGEGELISQNVHKYVRFESCRPLEEEALSVLGFEAIMVSLLAACAPIVYQRKRKASGSIAMGRMNSGSR